LCSIVQAVEKLGLDVVVDEYINLVLSAHQSGNRKFFDIRVDRGDEFGQNGASTALIVSTGRAG